MTLDRSSRAALIVACLTLAASGAGFRAAVGSLNVYLAKSPVLLRQPLELPRRAGDWDAVSEDTVLTEEVAEALGTDQYLDRTYAKTRPEGVDPAMVHVHVTYYTGMIDAVPHIADRCLVSAGWSMESQPRNLELALDRTAWRTDRGPINRRSQQPYPMLTYRHPITGEPNTVRMPVGDLRMRASTYRAKEHPDRKLYAGYFFIANGETTPWPEEVRWFAFDHSTRYAYYAKVQCSMYVGEDVDEATFVAAVADLLDELLPELMRCLPDWADIEARSPAGSEKRETE